MPYYWLTIFRLTAAAEIEWRIRPTLSYWSIDLSLFSSSFLCLSFIPHRSFCVDRWRPFTGHLIPCSSSEAGCRALIGTLLLTVFQLDSVAAESTPTRRFQTLRGISLAGTVPFTAKLSAGPWLFPIGSFFPSFHFLFPISSHASINFRT